MSTEDIINLLDSLSPTTLTIEDLSHLHAHHREGGKDSGSHFKVAIGSDQFSGLSRLKAHRLVMATLQPAFDAGVHSISIMIC